VTTEVGLKELQDLMRLYRDGSGYVKSDKEFDSLTTGMSEGEKTSFLNRLFLSAVVKKTSDYITEIEQQDGDVTERAYKVAVSLLLGALDIANLFKIEMSEKVMETLMTKFATEPVSE